MLFKSLDQYFDKQGVFTKARYIKMCKQLGKTPDPDEMPMGANDFPPLVRDSIDIYNRLGDVQVSTPSGILYTGKNLATLDFMFNLFKVHPDDRMLSLQIIQHLDYKAVKKSSDALAKRSKKSK